MTTIERPDSLQINAWTPGLDNRDTLPSRTPWAQQKKASLAEKWMGPRVPVDLRNWRHPDVGWGLVLPDNDALTPQAKAAAEDAPPAIRKLLESRPGAPVLRWQASLQQNYLRRYYADGRAQDLSVQAPKPGTADGRIPRYLLIYASPAEIPWAVQYALNMSTFVGRLALTGKGLENYVGALISNWKGAAGKSQSPLVWSVDHGAGDITWLMARAVAGSLWQKFEADSELAGRTRLGDDQATGKNLVDALKANQPGLIVTTSHGMTGPLDDAQVLKAQLGLLVDAGRTSLPLDDIAAWDPGGAIWYAHACCSAGSDSSSRYKTLLENDGSISKTLNGVAEKAGAMISPLPEKLLGAEVPLRAFVGHVEPTFDWTLRDPQTKQVLTHVLSEALYETIYQQDMETPIGFALRSVFAEAGSFYGAWQEAIAGINQNLPGMRDLALYRQLVAMDRQTLVIIGDPTVSLPPLKAGPPAS